MPSVAETQLDLYNRTLDICEERHLASLTEARKPRYLLDSVWNGGGVNACLEESDWDFARRTVQMVNDPSIQPNFGYTRAFKHPPDWLRTSAISSDPYFQSALTNYSDEGGYWWADVSTLYVKFVSTDPAYGWNLTNWSEAFKDFCAAHFAMRIVGGLTHDREIKDKVAAYRKTTLDNARSKDAMNEPPGFFSRGRWSRARQGMYSGRPTGTGSGWY